MDEEDCSIVTEAEWNRAQEAARQAIRRIAACAYLLLRKTDIPFCEVPGTLRTLCRDYHHSIITKASKKALARMKRESRRSRFRRDTLKMMELHDLETLWRQS